MKAQIIQDYNGLPTGVFIPIEDWTLIKNCYPDIETIEQELPQWEKDLIDERLEVITKNPKRLRTIESLFEELKCKI